MTDIFIGWTPQDAIAAEVCASSIRRRTKRPIRFLKQTDPDVSEVYKRSWHWQNGVMIDDLDGKPFSTEFAFTRFLVPHLRNFEGWAIFCDADTQWLRSPDELFMLADNRYAVMVVKHQHIPKTEIKMGGAPQTRYYRKNWSSVILWNCGHPHNKALTPLMVNHMAGQYLHGFYWLKDEEIGELDASWNYLVGTSSDEIRPDVLHWTEGAPTIKGYNNAPYAESFWAEARDYFWAGR